MKYKKPNSPLEGESKCESILVGGMGPLNTPHASCCANACKIPLPLKGGAGDMR